jgi:outer membrane protein TolC
VRLNKSALKVSQHELEITVIKLLATVTNAYFEMVFGQENLLVKRQAVELAENLVHESDRRVQEGKLAPLDVVQAKVRLSEAQEELLLAENFLAQRRNTLRALTRDKIEFEEAEWLVDGSFLTRVSPELQRDHLLARMFERNPSYLAGIELARSEDIRIAYARNQRWPRVDLKASYTENGLGADWEDAYAKIHHRHGPSWSLGLVVNVPITRRVERARLGEAKSRKAQALLNIKQTEVQLLSAFDTAFRDIRSAQERMALVHGSVGLAETALRAEERRLANGTTTSYNVGVVQRDLSTARSRELATVVDLNKAVTGLYALIGTLPEQMRVDVTAE